MVNVIKSIFIIIINLVAIASLMFPCRIFEKRWKLPLISRNSCSRSAVMSIHGCRHGCLAHMLVWMTAMEREREEGHPVDDCHVDDCRQSEAKETGGLTAMRSCLISVSSVTNCRF